MLYFVENYYSKRIFLDKYYSFLVRIFGQTWQKQPRCWKRNLNINFKLV
jgi:hypothetical protein